MRKLSLLFILLLGCAAVSLAQTKDITGTVTRTGEEAGLPGVEVIHPGSNFSTVTGTDGQFTITLPETATSLTFRMTGMIDQVVDISSVAEVMVELEPDLMGIYEEIPLGFTNIEKRKLVGSVSGISDDGIEKTVDTDLTTALQGQVSGVQVTQVGGTPGAYVDLKVRGVSSINSGSNPLIVIDGMPVDNDAFDVGGFMMSGLAELNPGDIESVHVLKDATATALYGVRGANGVIVITTKKGQAGDNRIQLSYQSGMSQPTNRISLLNGPDYQRLLNQALQNSIPDSTQAPIVLDGYDGFYAYDAQDTSGATITANPSDTDWLDEVLQAGKFQQISVAVHGGNDNTTYYLSGHYRNEKNILLNGKFNKASGRIHLAHKVSNKLDFGFNLFGSYNTRDVNDKEWFEWTQTRTLPVYPVMSPADDRFFWYTFYNEVNPMMLNEYAWQKQWALRTIDQVYVNFNIIEGLKLRSEWGIDFQYSHLEDYKHPYVFPSGAGYTTGNGVVIQNRYDNTNWNTNNTLTYTRSFGDHNLNAMAGLSVQRFLRGGQYMHIEDLGLIFKKSNGQSNKAERVRSEYTDTRFASFYGIVNYDLAGKYLAQVSLRSDGSSRFGKDNRWGYFPAFGLGWMLSEESFVKNLSFLDLAKIRASYGITGNSNFRDYLHMGVGMPGSYDVPGVINTGLYFYGEMPAYVPTTLSNPNLTWETVSQMDVGLDLIILKGKVGITVDYYSKKTSDMIIGLPVSILMGYENTMYPGNGGVLTNSGIDFTHNLNLIKATEPGGFSWSANVYITTVKTTLDELPDEVDYIESHYNRSEPGQPFGAYYLVKWAGVDQLTGHELIYNKETGMAMDAEMLTDEEFDAQRTLLTDYTPFPKIYSGIGNTFSFKGFELSVLFSHQGGNHVLDLGEQSLSYIGSGSTGIDALNDGWTASTPTNTPLLWESAMSNRVTDRYLKEASYWRLRTLRLGYNLPSSLLERVQLSGARIYVNAQNLLTFSKFEGWDPEAISSFYNPTDNMDVGLIMFELPQVKYLSFGIDLTF